MMSHWSEVAQNFTQAFNYFGPYFQLKAENPRNQKQ